MLWGTPGSLYTKVQLQISISKVSHIRQIGKLQCMSSCSEQLISSQCFERGSEMLRVIDSENHRMMLEIMGQLKC